MGDETTGEKKLALGEAHGKLARELNGTVWDLL